MKGLFIKDLSLILYEYKVAFIFATVISIVSGVEGDNSFIFFIPSMIILSLSLQFFSDDERSHWMMYREFMPVRRCSIVIERYIEIVKVFL